MRLIENGITTYFHCKNCFSNGIKDKVAVGWKERQFMYDISFIKFVFILQRMNYATFKGLQVWCDSCDTNIIALDFKGNKVAHDLFPEGKYNSTNKK